jgi:hypothetical protein
MNGAETPVVFDLGVVCVLAQIQKGSVKGMVGHLSDFHRESGNQNKRFLMSAQKKWMTCCLRQASTTL